MMFRLQFGLLSAVLFLSCLADAQSPASQLHESGAAKEEVPGGTLLHIRLRQTISSFGSKQDTPISAIVIQPVALDDQIVLPMNTELRGTIARVRRIGVGLSHETALLDLRFDTLILPGGQPQTIVGHISAVDNSRETVDAKGVIHGIRATASTAKVLSGLAISAAAIDPMSQLFAASASLSTFRIPESEIILPVGAELTYKTDQEIPVAQQFPGLPPFLKEDPETTQLTDLVRPLPFRTATTKPSTPSDLISFLYLGSEESIRKAFDAAGWVPADPLSTQSKYGVMRSIMENQGYREGPVSTLLLEGQPPTMVFSKTLDTFFARHHLRIYSQPGTFDGQPIFSSTATHDSGIGLNKKAKSMIHLIDEHIDEERGKVVDDLWLTGCVDSVSYIERPWVPRDAKNATGDTLITDGRLAVLRLNDCADPHRADVPDSSLGTVQEKAPAVERFGRNTVLYLRDDFGRGNIVYQGYSGVKTFWGMTHKKPQSAGTPTVLNVGGEPYQVVSRPSQSMPKGGPKDATGVEPSFVLPGMPRSYKTKLEFSISGGGSFFANDQFATQSIILSSTSPPPIVLPQDFVNYLHGGFTIAPKATINSWKYISNEFGYTYNKAPLEIAVNTPTGPFPGLVRHVADANGQIRQFTYNALLQLRPNGKRFRPYGAIGPSFQLLRLTEAKPQVNPLLKLAIKDLGLIVGAYQFGSKPPLEGGGIFQFGFQYGGGFKYQITPRFFTRVDFRETLSPQPDYWTKSYPTLRKEIEEDPTDSLEIKPLQKFGPLRQDVLTAGFGISF